ncbi:mycothiol transferase [Cellulomonas sp. NPDC055163]
MTDTDDLLHVEEPSMTAGEVEMLLFALDRSRATFAWKTGGLDAEALNRRQPPSTMTLGGLLKHLALVEDKYTVLDVTGRPSPHGQGVQRLGPPWDTADPDDPEWAWTSAADDSPEALYALWRGAVARSRAAWAATLADGGLGQHTRSPMWDGDGPNLRRVLVDLHDEYARHTGHADLLREAVDGLVGEDPPQHG